MIMMHLPRAFRRWRAQPTLLAALLITLTPPAAGELAAQSEAEERSLEELAERATPAVVLIDVETASDTRQGSGFIVDPAGLILTNHHVIRDARSARVRLASGDVYQEVEVLADDPRRDIAILRVPGFELPSLPLGNSDSIRIGSPVVLIGSPLGLENTVSTGIVSGRRQEPEGYQLLQVSAPASRGSSGGAVLSTRGDVVGIAVSQIQGGQNLNFAVPINYARGLLTHLGEEPVTVLRPTAMNADEPSAERPSPTSNSVNQGLEYLLDGFGGYQIEMEVALDQNRTKRTRVTYRFIETVNEVDPRIERYMESETTERTEPFGTVQTLERERSRVVVSAGALSPISATGETAWWTGSGWVTSGHDLRFEGGRVTGVLTDTAGAGVDLDRDLPDGIVLSDMRDLAFAVLDVDSLVGRSVEFVTFDPRTAEVEHERFDVRDTTRIDVDGASRQALRVNVASGLENETLYFLADRPRVFLRRESAKGKQVEEITSLIVFPRSAVPPRPPGPQGF
jgi:hypothetical protein